MLARRRDLAVDDPSTGIDDRRIVRAIGLDHRHPVLGSPEDQMGIVLVGDAGPVTRGHGDQLGAIAGDLACGVRKVEVVADDRPDLAKVGRVGGVGPSRPAALVDKDHRVVLAIDTQAAPVRREHGHFVAVIHRIRDGQIGTAFRCQIAEELGAGSVLRIKVQSTLGPDDQFCTLLGRVSGLVHQPLKHLLVGIVVPFHGDDVGCLFILCPEGLVVWLDGGDADRALLRRREQAEAEQHPSDFPQ